MAFRPRIIIDDREKSQVRRHLDSLGADIIIQHLPVGDYQVSDDMCFEYKSISDFLSSEVGEEKLKLHRQIFDLVAGYPKPALLIGGTIQDLLSFRNMNPNAIFAMLQSIIWAGCPIRFLNNELIVANYIYECAKKEQEPHALCRYFQHHGFKSTLTHRQRAERICEWLPGVGATKSHLLIEHFGSVQETINASYKDLMKVEGIGYETAVSIRNAVTPEKVIPIFI